MPSDPAKVKGCQPQAELKMTPRALTQQTKDDLARLRSRIQADARVVAATAKWHVCMSAAGFDQFANPDAPSEYFQSEVSRIMNYEALSKAKMAGRSHKAASAGSSTSTVPDDPTADRPWQHDSPVTADQRRQLDPLAAEERKVATADFKCEAADLTQVVRDVTLEYQQQFLTDHPDAR